MHVSGVGFGVCSSITVVLNTIFEVDFDMIVA